MQTCSTPTDHMAASSSLQTDPREKSPESVLSNLDVTYLEDRWDLPY